MLFRSTLAAVIVLLLNDHLLKQAWPGFVTGKLSDVAGLIVAPPLVALLFARRADLAATLLTGVLFALVKTTQTGAETASHLWTLVAGPSRVLADPADLLALPALGLAWWIRGHTDIPTRWRVLVATPLAILAVSATSAVPSISTSAVQVVGSTIKVYGPATVVDSQDGGATWSVSEGESPLVPQTAACVPGQPQRCYRVVPGELAVDESDDYGKKIGRAHV